MNNESSGCYIIDSEYNVVNVNVTARKLYPQLQVGKKCYKCLMGIDEPCGPCPVAAGRKGPATYTDPIRNISEIVDAVDVELEGHGPCHMLIFSTVENEAKFAATLPTSEEELKDLALIKALTVDYCDVFSVNLENQMITLYRLDGNSMDDTSIFRDNIAYENQMEDYIRKYVFSEDQEMMRKSNRLSYLKEVLTNTEAFLLHYRVKYKGELHYYYRRFVRIGDADNFENIVVGVGCEDEEVKEREKRVALQDTLRKVEMDAVTGLLTKEAFFVYADHMLKSYVDKEFDFIYLKVNNLEAISRQYGEMARDRVIQSIGEVLKDYQEDTNRISYFEQGAFGSFSEINSEEKRKEKIRIFQEQVAKRSNIYNLEYKWVIYKNIDRSITSEEIYKKVSYAFSMIPSGLRKDYMEFTQEMLEQMDWEASIREHFHDALQNEEFEVWYQPKYSVENEKIAGAEALVRWRQKNGELIVPNRFIPILENSGLINLLDEEVFRQVCQFQMCQKEEGKEVLPISVNLSRASMFTRDIPQEYAEIADFYGVDHHMIPIEITESAAIRSNMIKNFAQDFLERDFVLHMDDFGSGYSSLASLQMIPFGGIKIDKSLVDFIGEKNGENLLKHTIAFAKESGMLVVAEGVESIRQYSFLKATGCDMIQGYYFSKPVEKETFQSILSQQHIEED